MNLHTRTLRESLHHGRAFVRFYGRATEGLGRLRTNQRKRKIARAERFLSLSLPFSLSDSLIPSRFFDVVKVGVYTWKLRNVRSEEKGISYSRRERDCNSRCSFCQMKFNFRILLWSPSVPVFASLPALSFSSRTRVLRAGRILRFSYLLAHGSPSILWIYM